MLHYKVINRISSGFIVSEELMDNLEQCCREWCRKYINNCSIILLISDSDSDELCSFSFSKQVSGLLENSVAKSMLFAAIDIELRDYDKYKRKVCFAFFVGYTESDLLDKADTESTPKKSISTLIPVEPKYSLSQVILDDATKEELNHCIVLLKNISKIYYDWGFIDIDPVPRSIVNFWGPPGTGKTMCVHAIAKELNKKVLILNYADIESKYVGEAPKNLIAAFDLAKKEDAILFFDEADSFLGKRIMNVDSGSEQAINSLRSQMLMKLEEFNGTVFFATNLHENYDRAFESRILKHIKFSLPDVECRKQLICKKIPSKAPLASDICTETGTLSMDLAFKLAEIVEGFSGREIKNCILESLVKAAQTEEEVLSESILVSTFQKAKESFDLVKERENKKKAVVGEKVKENLKTDNYSVKKIDED